MVFGLATKQELSSISKHKYNKQYCDGSYRLSQIQYLISRNTEIHSNITSKGVLRPYSFACSGENSFTIGLDIKNCQNRLDYRLEYAQIYSVCFIVLFIILLICFIVIAHKLQRFSDISNILISFLILFYTCENVIFYFFFKLPTNHEYLADLLSFESENYMKDNYLYFNIAYQAFSCLCCIIVFLIHLNVSKFQLKKKKKMLVFIFCLISTVPLALILYYQFTKVDGITLPFIIYMIYIMFYFLFYTYYTYTKIGIVVFLSGRFVTFVVQPNYFQASASHIGTNIAMIGLFWFSLIIQILTIALFSVGSLYFHDSDDLFEEYHPNPTPNIILRYEDNVYTNLINTYQEKDY